MRFLEYIENIRKKPEPTRKMAALVVVSVLAFLIIGTWAATFSLSPVDSAGKISPQPASSSNAAPEASPFELLWEMIKEIRKAK